MPAQPAKPPQTKVNADTQAVLAINNTKQLIGAVLETKIAAQHLLCVPEVTVRFHS